MSKRSKSKHSVKKGAVLKADEEDPEATLSGDELEDSQKQAYCLTEKERNRARILLYQLYTSRTDLRK